jgi:hypothetical protein
MRTLFLMIIGFSNLLFANGYQVNYQGIFLDSNGAGKALNDSVQFKLFSVRNAGTPLWAETHFIKSKTGVFTVNLGSKISLTKDLFIFDSLFLEISKGSISNSRIKIGGYVYA